MPLEWSKKTKMVHPLLVYGDSTDLLGENITIEKNMEPLLIASKGSWARQILCKLIMYLCLIDLMQDEIIT